MRYFLLIYDEDQLGDWIFWMTDNSKDVLVNVAERMNHVKYVIIEGNIVVGDFKPSEDLEDF